MVLAQINSLEAEKERIKSDLDTLVEFKKGFQTEELKTLAQELTRNSQINIELSSELLFAQRELTRYQEKALIAETDLKDSGILLRNKIAQREKVENELKQEETNRTRTMALPKQQETNKQEVPIFLKSAKLFFLTDRASRFGTQLNLQHFEKTISNAADVKFAGEHYRIKQANGLPIANQSTTVQLKQYNGATHFFTFVVRSDSFDYFGILRDQCVKHGYEYRIIPSDELIGEGSSSTTRTQIP
ncbi:hypothetical protein N9B05_02590 [Mariniblastus sp.]|nr:hypothetical protein [Mariniblastus sp.]